MMQTSVIVTEIREGVGNRGLSPIFNYIIYLPCSLHDVGINTSL